MSLVTDIARSYRAPRVVMREQMDRGVAEAQTVFIGMLFCFLNFIANTPQRAMIAQANGDDQLGSFAANFVATVFLLLLFMYLLTWIVNVIFKILTKRGTPAATRRAFFWAALVTSPMVLITGASQPFASQTVILLLQATTAVLFIYQLYFCIKESRV